MRAQSARDGPDNEARQAANQKLSCINSTQSRFVARPNRPRPAGDLHRVSSGRTHLQESAPASAVCYTFGFGPEAKTVTCKRARSLS